MTAVNRFRGSRAAASHTPPQREMLATDPSRATSEYRRANSDATAPVPPPIGYSPRRMLLTLNAQCVRGLLQASPKGRRQAMSIFDLPAFTRQTLGLNGLNLSTDMLVGFDRAQLENLRERADKAACSCLLLIESEAQSLIEPDAAEAAVARMRRVITAASILGCNSAAMRIKAPDSDPALEVVAKRLKQVSEPAEKLDLTLLIAPSTGLTSTPERLTDLIKKVGGFRIGTFPDFQAAAASKDPSAYLRRLCPYAQAVSASSVKFKDTGKTVTLADGETERVIYVHETYDLNAMVKAVVSVGFEGTIGIDYRGDGDVVAGVTRTRDVLLDAIGGVDHDAEDEEDELDLGEEVEETEPGAEE